MTSTQFIIVRTAFGVTEVYADYELTIQEPKALGQTPDYYEPNRNKPIPKRRIKGKFWIDL